MARSVGVGTKDLSRRVARFLVSEIAQRPYQWSELRRSPPPCDRGIQPVEEGRRVSPEPARRPERDHLNVLPNTLAQRPNVEIARKRLERPQVGRNRTRPIGLKAGVELAHALDGGDLVPGDARVLEASRVRPAIGVGSKPIDETLPGKILHIE